MVSKINKQNVTPSDYCVFVSNLPIYKNQDQVKEWLKSILDEIEIIDVIFCNDISDMIKKEKELERLRQMENYLSFYKEKVLKENKITEQEAEEKEISPYPEPRSSYFFYKKSFIPIEILQKMIQYNEKQYLTIRSSIEY
jgi:hypothetical protein